MSSSGGDATRAVLVSLLLTTAACGHQNNSTCGYLYRVQGVHPAVSVGGCAGSLHHDDPTKITTFVGDTITISRVAEADGTSNLPVPKPDNDGLRLLGTEELKSKYRALHAGRVTLAVTTPLCSAATTSPPETPGTPHTCPVVQVEIVHK